MADRLDYRPLHPGMGQAVAERTYLRRKENNEWENWGDVAHRVALGNSLLAPTKFQQETEFAKLQPHIANGVVLMSGRHLQHGDETQPERNMEIFTNCSTAASSFMMFYLLLNGSGVGRSYDDEMMLANWDNAPNVRCVIDHDHDDFDWSAHESLRDAKHKYGSGRDTLWFTVPDSREGWAKALEIWENAAFEKVHKDKMLILDFSNVRPKGSPIGGMQNRPSSGPVPLMNAFHKAATLKGSNLERWRQALYIDHYFAECVLVGGARRSARMSTKTWRDESVLGFITVKRPIEYDGLKMEEITELRKTSTPDGFLWSSNNSVTVDEDFWRLCALKRKDRGFSSPLAQHARRVLRSLTQASYADGTGEPGIINVDKLVQKEEGWDLLTNGDYIGSKKYSLEEDTELYMSRLARKAKKMKYHMITNPCGEIALTVLGGYCTIADVVPYHAETLDEAEDAFRAAVRALIRVNTMDCLYATEVKRTNRIGVGMTGVMEFAWKFFRYSFHDLIDEEKSKDFWLTLARFNQAIYDEAVAYSKKLGVGVPHTMTTIKPAGCQIADTMLATSEGFLQLGEIGDIAGSRWQQHNMTVYADGTPAHSDQFFVNGMDNTIRLSMNSGLTLESTWNHKYRVIRDGSYIWVEAQDIIEGDFLPYSVGEYEGGSPQSLSPVVFEVSKYATQQVMITQPDVLTEDIAFFLGMYFGDGSNHERSIRISGDSRYQKGFEELNRIVKESFGVVPLLNEDHRDGNRCSLNVNSNQLLTFLEHNGLLKQRSHQIEVPELVRRSPKSVILSFIDGFITADGNEQNSSGRTFVTTSKTFATQMTIIMRGVGLDAKMREMPATDSSKGNRMRYWVSERKGRNAQRYVRNNINNAWDILDAEGLTHMNVDEVISKDYGTAETYDISVPGNHTFQANSYISHNTTSKLFGLCEGWHLPSMAWYVRWVQFREDDPLIDTYRDAGYPVRTLKQYRGHVIVGFPTQPVIASIMDEGKLVTAAEATPEQQYKWLMLGEKYYINGTDEDGVPVTDRNIGNQISYCLAGDKNHLIPTSTGLQRIENMVLSETNDRHGNSQRVVDLVDNGVKPTRVARLQNGIEIIGTEAHRLLTLSDDLDLTWKTLGELQVGDIVVRRVGDNQWNNVNPSLPILGNLRLDGRKGNTNQVHAPTVVTPQFALFLGMLLSDGHISDNSVGLTTVDHDVAELFSNLLWELFGLVANVRFDTRAEGIMIVEAHSRAVVRWIEEVAPTARNHNRNYVPACILSSTKECVEQFIRGYTLDGHVTSRSGWIHVCTTVSETMAKDLLAMLSNLGYDAYVGRKEGREYHFSDANCGMGLDQYVVYLGKDSSVAFASSIGFVESHKTEAASRISVSSQPHKANMVPSKIFAEHYAENRNRYKDNERLRSIIKADSNGISVNTVRREFSDLNFAQPVLDDHLRFTRVTSIEDGVPMHTYDITVDISHEYVANSVVVHNTLKYKPELVEYGNFKDMLVKYQSQIRACSVMPQEEMTAYEYQPEEPVTKAEYEKILHAIRDALEEDIGKEHLDCSTGACPINFEEGTKSDLGTQAA